MDCLEFLRQLDKGVVPSIVSVFGSDGYWHKKVIEKLTALADPFDLTVFDGVELSDVIVALDTIPLMGEKRVVIVRELAKLDNNAKSDKKTLEMFAAYQKSPNPTSILVFDFKSSFDGVTEVVCDKLKGNQLVDEITEIFASLGKKADKKVILKLIDYLECDMSKIYTECRKLASFSINDITEADLLEVVEPDVSYKMYNLANYLIKGDYVSTYNLIRKSDEKTLTVLQTMIKTYRFAFYCKTQKYYELSEVFGVSSFVARTAQTVSKAYTARALYSLLMILYQLEFDIKSGKILEDNALTIMISEAIERRIK